MPLYNSTAVMDIVAILKFVSNPFDDLNLSVVLKGPLWSFSDQDIYKLAINKKIYMIKELKEKNPKIYKILMEIVSHGNDMHAFDFINYILHNLDLYNLFLNESDKNKEIIEEFMEFVYENDTNIRSFLKFFMENSPIMKRSTESQEGVKIMTIHNAKGLESKIVIMADTTICMLEDMVPAKRKPYIIDNDLFYYFKNHESDYFKTKVNEDLDLKRMEQDRLLYVGMTRAKSELHIMGYKSIQYKKSWHYMIMEKIKNDNDFKLQDNIYVLKDQKDSESHTKTKKQKHKEAVIEREYEKATNTKTNIINKKIESITNKKTGFINERGLLIHKKLEITDIKKDSYANKMLANKNINWIFKRKSYAEVPVMIEKENKEYRIDRMVIEGDTLHIIDYKTDKLPPTSPLKIPKQYITQMQNYMELFIDEYKIVRCYILWTSNNNLMEIDIKKTKIAI